MQVGCLGGGRVPGGRVLLDGHRGTGELFNDVPGYPTGDDLHMLMALAMAASYDPDPDGPKGVRLPVDLFTGELDAELWANWMRHDPVELVKLPECQANLRSLRGLYIDCGSKDQYSLVYGARAFVNTLNEAGIDHRYEEFEDDHTGVDYRQDVSFPYLYEAIT